MKRHGNLYQKICDFENLDLAFYKVSLGRRYYGDILQFKDVLEENLIRLQRELINKTYTPSPYRTFTLYEPKKRTIYVSPVKDRIVHHAIMNIVEPIWDKLFIYDSYACRKDKGTHAGVSRTVEFLRRAQQTWGKVYCLKCDITKFFPSINHHRMLQVISQKIKCKDTLWLFEQIIFNNTFDRNDPESKNMPIGNLISQWGANLYLNVLDQYIKHCLKTKYYIRYMDDFLILDGDRKELHRLKREISLFLNNHLKLGLNTKSDIYPVDRGIDFLGYRIWHNNILLRKSSLIRATRRFKKLSKAYKEGLINLSDVKCSLFSWLGHCQHANVKRGTNLCLKHLVLSR
ncbi:MAG TPA: reverse transcriptase domain-containing protein [Syntrophorhabdaceae bacterium]|nr:reverse transcriptase domain-containing protein [Syntrophorhabdaceae bacterium]